MNGARALAVVLLVALGAVGGVSVAAQDQPQPSMSVLEQTNTSGMLAPDPGAVERTGQATPRLDVATAVSANAGGIQGLHRQAELERRYQAADTADRRRAVVEAGAQQASERLDRLRQRERAAFQRYRNGEIGEQELLRAIAEVHQAASVTEETLLWVETRADGLGASAVSAQAGTDRVRAIRLQSPLRERIAGSVAGQQSFRVHVEASADGFVLAGIHRGVQQTYLREAYDTTARSNFENNYDGIPEALDRVGELYPWAFENSNGIDDARPIGPSSARVYRVEVSHAHGSVAAYLAGGSGEVLREYQEKDPERIPTRDFSRTGDDLRVEVNATRSGGPVGVTAVDGAGTPVDATVTTNGDRLGSTDGSRLWAITLPGGSTINVSHGGETVTVELAG